MKTEQEVRKELQAWSDYLRYVEKNIPAGSGAWRTTKAKIEILQWVLDEE